MPAGAARDTIGAVTSFSNLRLPAGLRRPGYLLLLVLAAAGLIWGLAGPVQAQHWIRPDFRQSQTTLSVTIESSRTINSSHWSYAGPLDDRSQCSNQKFPDLDDSLKGKAPVTKLGDKKARAEISISRADNNKLYCFIIEGSPTPRQLDYNPPIIELGQEGNLIKARDAPSGAYGPNGNVDDNSWQVAVFDASRAGNNYRCGADNRELEFRPISGDTRYIGQYSWGNTNHLAYNVPDHRQSAIEFFDSLKAAIYATEEANPALIPFVDDQWNPAFTDNIHLCHRVSDPQGNTSYKLMRLDFGGPAIRLQIDGQSIRASSVAVDLDQSTWQYLATDQRHIRTTCELIKDFPDPTGRSAVVDRAVDSHYYCFLVADKRGNIGRAWIRAKLEAAPPTTTEESAQPEADEPQPTNNNDQSNQQLTDPAPVPDQAGPETIDGQTADITEADPAELPPQPAEPETTPEATPADNQTVPGAGPEPAAANQPTGDRLGWTVFWSLIALLAVITGGWLAIRNKTKRRSESATGND